MTDPIMDEFRSFNNLPREWVKYRCRSCDHTDWIDEIIVDAFPPTEPGGFPALACPECGGDFLNDPTEPPRDSVEHPDCPS
jgi:hypothetical protein